VNSAFGDVINRKLLWVISPTLGKHIFYFFLSVIYLYEINTFGLSIWGFFGGEKELYSKDVNV
jgi:hypothetical protein